MRHCQIWRLQLRAELGHGGEPSCSGGEEGGLHAASSGALGAAGNAAMRRRRAGAGGLRWGMHASVVLVTLAALLFFERGDSPALSRKIVSSIIFPVSLCCLLPPLCPGRRPTCRAPATRFIQFPCPAL